MMDRAEKLALLEASLTRAAEVLGDVTPHVMNLYYARHPGAAASFEHHGLGKTAALEGEMIENCLYCLMYCLERPTEIEILLENSVPHHHFTLEVPLDWYQGLVDAAIDVMAGTVPADATAEQHVWAQIRERLGAIFTGCRDLLPEDAATALS
jgi:hypothetical protein